MFTQLDWTVNDIHTDSTVQYCLFSFHWKHPEPCIAAWWTFCSLSLAHWGSCEKQLWHGTTSFPKSVGQRIATLIWCTLWYMQMQLALKLLLLLLPCWVFIDSSTSTAWVSMSITLWYSTFRSKLICLNSFAAITFLFSRLACNILYSTV